MVERIFALSLQQRVFVLMGALALVSAGVWSALRLPIDAVPDITNVQVQINTAVASLSPEEIEREISFPLETEMAGLPGLEEVRSLSKFGLSQITMIFSDDTDVYRARQLVSERLQGVRSDLPDGAEPRLGHGRCSGSASAARSRGRCSRRRRAVVQRRPARQARRWSCGLGQWASATATNSAASRP